MSSSIIFYKELTAAEVGKTKTHEVYIRLPNDFDYISFFDNSATKNGTVIETAFTATDLTDSIYNNSVGLRFVYFFNSNNEKRIPSLGPLFKTHDVDEGDVVKLERKIENEVPKYYITFYKKGSFKLKPASIYIEAAEDEMLNLSLTKCSSNDESRQIIYYGAPGTGKSHKIKGLVNAGNHVRITFHPDSDYASFVGAYKPTMSESSKHFYSKSELIALLNRFKTTGLSYPCQKFGADHWYSLQDLSSTDIKEIINSCGFTEPFYQEVNKGISIGKYYYEQGLTDRKIVYEFVAQAFLQAYTEAWKRYVGIMTDTDGKNILMSEGMDDKYYLVIEEINRGNCAQIFGDLFQLLDRDDSGQSSYAIRPDQDMKRYLAEQFKGIEELPDAIRKGEIMKLPSNLYIFSTMNTSDQSLFPIDSAFKRRWDWEYIPIDYDAMDWQFEVDGKRYLWSDFLKKINPLIYNLTQSSDKQMGYFFAKADKKTDDILKENNLISEKIFLNKVLFYLWTDVLKDFDAGDKIFRDEEKGQMYQFCDFFPTTNGKLAEFVSKLELHAVSSEDTNEDETEITNDNDETDEDADNENVNVNKLVIKFSDGTVIKENTRFNSYKKALELIGLDRIEPIAQEKKYKRHDSSLITKVKEEGILNDEVYSYIQSGNYYIVKGINTRTMRNLLNLISERLSLNLEVNLE